MTVEVYGLLEGYQPGTIANLSVMVEGEPETINFFSMYGKSRKRTIGRRDLVFVFCAGCNRRTQVRTFKP